MIIHPEIVLHPKFIALEALIGDAAMKYLVRLWGHCQLNKRGEKWPNATPLFVEIVAAGRSLNGKLFIALQDSGWIRQDDGCIVICSWNEHNAWLVSQWEKPRRQPVDKRSRPASDSFQNHSQSSSSPVPHQCATGDSLVADHSNLSSQIISYPVSPMSGGTERERERGRTSSGGQKTPPRANGAEIAALKTQVGVLLRQIKEMERDTDLDADGKVMLKKKRRLLAQIQERQSEGDFRLNPENHENESTQESNSSV